ncbi:hypothetical protein, partial [Vibrio owensii]|uniref:hypothetical protein n=1 Tax=Vibrio owensii TaxID=696485 RepID=UPI001D104E7F
ERRTVNPQVTGSSPVGGAILEKAASLDAAFLHLKKTHRSLSSSNFISINKKPGNIPSFLLLYRISEQLGRRLAQTSKTNVLCF